MNEKKKMLQRFLDALSDHVESTAIQYIVSAEKVPRNVPSSSSSSAFSRSFSAGFNMSCNQLHHTHTPRVATQ